MYRGVYPIALLVWELGLPAKAVSDPTNVLNVPALSRASLAPKGLDDFLRKKKRCTDQVHR